VLKGRLEKKLFDSRVESAARIDAMIRVAEASESEKKEFYRSLMADVLIRMRPSP